MMEGATTTRLRFKGEGGSSSRRSERGPPAQSRSSSKSRVRSRSRSRSPSHSSKKKRSRGSRSRSPSSSRSGRRDHPKRHSSKYKITPAGYAPASLSNYDYLFDPDDYSIHSPEAVYLREQERERQKDEAYEQEQEQQEEERQRDPWLRHLFDELANDDSSDYHSSLFESHVQSSFPHHRSHTSHIEALSDSDYTSYMRRGMRRSRAEKEAQEWEDWVQEQERTRYQQAKKDQKQKDERSSQRRQERKERERLEREANKDVGDTPANQLWKQKSVEAARRAYEHGWQMLTLQRQQKASESPLSMDMIPWPPLGATSESTTLPSSAPSSSSTSELSLFDFLFHGTTTDQLDVRKRLLRREQLRFHPDKFKQRFGARMPTERTSNGDERERILAMVEKVARAFNEIGEALQSAS